MSRKLAIKGHPTRGKEVIELLEMMGGKNIYKLLGSDRYAYCVIEGCQNEIRVGEYIFGDEDMCLFTLEEFLEKYPFKVGDLVDRNIDYVSCIIDDMRWNTEKCCVEYHLNYLNGSEYGWHVSDCLIKPENVDAIIGTKIESTGFMQIGKTVSVIFNSENYENEVELQLGDYEIEVRDGRTYAVKKKPKYPKTYTECCERVNACPTVGISYDTNEDMLYNDEVDLTLLTLRKLLICRNAYWKIAGVEMGLGKSWEPKFGKTILFDISFYFYQDNFVLHKGQYDSSDNCILIFPTEEIRDTFYENFKNLIESCKELL